jgi:acyl-[acyl-carrier-protein]-phospholipid O-acyltransferase/long-chain-fatty-acid--[acyl-carrier-protein] ligase
MMFKNKWAPLFSTNFLGVFNNNFFQTMIFLLAIQWVAKGSDTWIVPLGSALYVVSYIFFSPFAGRLAKMHHKKSIIIVSRLFEFMFFVTGSIGFYIHSVFIVMVCMFFLGLISTLFSPAKYGLIRDIGGNEGISFGTGTLEMFTFFGALLGPLVATIISDHYNVWLMSGMFLTFSLLSLYSIWSLKVEESEPMKEVSDTVNPIRFVINSFKWAETIKGMNWVILGLASFWMIGSFLRMTIIRHCPEALGMTNTQMGIVLSMAALGIGLGSYTAGIISRGKVELGLTPIGGAGMTIILLLLYILQPAGVPFTLLIFLTAFFCGIYMVPLSAFVQSSVEGRKQGDMIAYSNFAIFLFIFIAAGIFGVLVKYFSTNAIFIFLVIYLLCIIPLMLKNVGKMYDRLKILLRI